MSNPYSKSFHVNLGTLTVDERRWFDAALRRPFLSCWSISSRWRSEKKEAELRVANGGKEPPHVADSFEPTQYCSGSCGVLVDYDDGVYFSDRWSNSICSYYHGEDLVRHFMRRFRSAESVDFHYGEHVYDAPELGKYSMIVHGSEPLPITQGPPDGYVVPEGWVDGNGGWLLGDPASPYDCEKELAEWANLPQTRKAIYDLKFARLEFSAKFDSARDAKVESDKWAKAAAEAYPYRDGHAYDPEPRWLLWERYRNARQTQGVSIDQIAEHEDIGYSSYSHIMEQPGTCKPTEPCPDCRTHAEYLAWAS